MNLFRWVANFMDWIGCMVHEISPGSVPTCEAVRAARTMGGVTVFVFGIWMIVMAVTFSTIHAPWFGKLRTSLDFPEELGLWSSFFGVVLGSFGLMYLICGIYDVRNFFIMSAVGRLGVFVIALRLAIKYSLETRTSQTLAAGNPKPQTINRLILLAVPDLAFGIWTVGAARSTLAAIIFMLGAIHITLAVVFATFPNWLWRLLKQEAMPGTWNVVVASICAFFGSYNLIAAGFGDGPFMASALAADIFVAIMSLIVYAVSRAKAEPLEPDKQDGSTTNVNHAQSVLLSVVCGPVVMAGAAQASARRAARKKRARPGPAQLSSN